MFHVPCVNGRRWIRYHNIAKRESRQHIYHGAAFSQWRRSKPSTLDVLKPLSTDGHCLPFMLQKGKGRSRPRWWPYIYRTYNHSYIRIALLLSRSKRSGVGHTCILDIRPLTTKYHFVRKQRMST